MIDQSKYSQTTTKPAPSEFPDTQHAAQSSFVNNPDEINLLEYIYVLVKNKWWIIGALVFGLIAGYVAAIVKGPTYVAEAVIAAKENDSQKSPNLSSFGAFSGLVASQLNISANPGLDKIDLILSSRKFNAELIKKHGLLPMIIKIQSPKVYGKWFDTTKGEWKKDFKEPNLLLVGAGLSGFLKKETNKNNTMTLKIESKDSTFSDTLLSKYLQYLNVFIQMSVLTDAKENVSYLEKQLDAIADPLLREKIQSMIANELEKEMLVSKEAFRLIDPAIRTFQFKQKKLFPIVFGVGFSFIVVLIVIVFHAFASGQKTEEDKILIAKIKKRILF